jgi:putative DNA primase/helicase
LSNADEEKLFSLPQRMADFNGPPQSDTANAERFVHLFGNEVLYCPPEKEWYWWDGKRWKLDVMKHTQELALETAAAISNEAEFIDDPDLKKKLYGWAKQSNSHERLRAMLSCAAMRDDMKVSPEQLDASPWLFNVENGTLDLQTGELRTHSKEDRISCLAPCLYDEEAVAGTFLDFIYHAMEKDGPLVDWLQRFLGYCLSGVTNKQCFALFHGKSNTGKSTLLNICHAVMGNDYSGTISSHSLFKPYERESQIDLNHVVRCRLVTTNESIEGKSFPESFIKSITGGESMSMRKMYVGAAEFTPIYKIIIGTNFKPAVREAGDAIWRRMVYVPFRKVITNIDLEFAQRVANEERSGILNWLLRGARLASEMKGFTERPLIVEEAMQEYKSEEDIVGEFLEARCEEGEDFEVRFGELYAAFRKYREELEDKKYTMSAKGFALRLDGRGVERSKNGHYREKMRKGIRLRELMA